MNKQNCSILINYLENTNQELLEPVLLEQLLKYIFKINEKQLSNKNQNNYTSLVQDWHQFEIDYTIRTSEQMLEYYDNQLMMAIRKQQYFKVEELAPKARTVAQMIDKYSEATDNLIYTEINNDFKLIRNQDLINLLVNEMDGEV